MGMPDYEVLEETEHLRFEYTGDSKSGKTKLIDVWSVKSQSFLGVIKWYGHWRKYVFDTEKAIYDTGCMRTISDFIDKLMEERKEK